MSNLGNGIIGFFGGESSGGGGTSTGVNGLNGTTSIGLGGTLTGNTLIYGGGFTLTNTQFDNYVIETQNGLGDFTSIGSYGSYIRLWSAGQFFIVEESNIYTSNGLDKIGLSLNFTNRSFVLGDVDDTFNQTKFIVDDTNRNITSQVINGTSRATLLQDFNLIQTTFEDGVLSAQEGFYLDFSVRQYVFGGTDALINCDSTNQTIIFNTKFLQLDNLTLNSGVTTPSANSIPITINSVQYYILLAT